MEVVKKPNNGGGILDNKANAVRDRIKIILISTFIWGLLAHGFMMFNKISYHDDTAMFFGATGMNSLTGQGRWMWGFFELLLGKIYVYDYSIPLYKGLFAFLFIAVSFMLISEILEYKNKAALVMLSGILVVNTTVTCLFGYIYMSLIFTFAMMMSIMAAYIICKFSKWYFWCIALVLNVCAIGTYQLFFCTGMCTIIIYMIRQTMEDDIEWKKWWIQALKYIVFCGISLVLYVVFTKLFVHIYNVSLTDYANIDSMGIVGIRQYIKRILFAYAVYFNPQTHIGDGIYPSVSIWGYHISAIALLMIFFMLVIGQFQRGARRRGLQLTILFVLFPLAINFICVLAGYSYVMTFYCHIFLYILLIFLVERFLTGKVGKTILGGCLSLMLLLNIFFCRYDNACYLKAEVLMENAKSYFTTLITRIQSTEGYLEEYPVAFIEPRKKYVINDGITEEFRNIRTVPYNTATIVNDYMWSRFMYLWCGYQAKEVTGEDYESYVGLDEVKKMPSYPADGSIKVIDQVVVVKFADPEQYGER